MSPFRVEAGAVVVLLLFLLLSGGVRLRDLVAVAAGAWIGEELCIRLYGAYQYAPGWTVFVDRVPLAIVLIWPAVVLSGRAVQRATGVPAWLVVLFDACLIEPIATHARLWSWNLPGAFGVPPIGPVGWACFAAAACWQLDRGRELAAAPVQDAATPVQVAALPGRELAAALRTVVVAPLLAQAGILAAWWGALRWVQAEILSAAAIGLSVFTCASGAVLALRLPRLPWREAIPRSAAAAIFAALLFAAPDRALLLYAAPFVLPWIALLDWRF